MAQTLYLVAHVAGRGIAIETGRIDSVIDIGPIVPVPVAAPGVRGLAALRSRVVTVVDTWAMLGLPTPAEPPRRAIVVRDEGFDYAMLVDTLDDVAPFAATPLAPGLALGEGWAAAGCAMVEHDGEALLVIDPARLLPRARAAA